MTAVSTSPSCRAGHPLPLHIDRQGAVRPVDIAGSFIGVTAEPQLSTCHLHLKPAEGLLLYTDGITEARNRDHQQLGEERLAHALSRELGQTPTAQQVIDVVTSVVSAFAGGTDLGDDQAALALTAVREEQGQWSPAAPRSF